MLDPLQLSGVEAHLRAVEARTGVQVVVAAIERADVYHGLRWRAFALGAAASGLVVSLGGAPRHGFLPEPLALTALARRGAVVTEDVPAHSVVGGVPARILRTIDGEARPASRPVFFATQEGGG